MIMPSSTTEDHEIMGIWQQQECVGRNPEKNVPEEHMHEWELDQSWYDHKIWEYIDTIREQIPGDAHSLS